MPGKAQIMTPEGVREFPLYMDNREVAADMRNGVIAQGSRIVYRNLICEVIGDFVDEDGETNAEMLVESNINL